MTSDSENEDYDEFGRELTEDKGVSDENATGKTKSKYVCIFMYMIIGCVYKDINK